MAWKSQTSTPASGLHYSGISHTPNQVVELDEWVRRRVRLYYWIRAQGDGPQYACGNERSEEATGTYWRTSANSIVQRALANRWLREQGVPDMCTLWIALHYGPNARL